MDPYLLCVFSKIYFFTLILDKEKPTEYNLVIDQTWPYTGCYGWWWGLYHWHLSDQWRGETRLWDLSESVSQARSAQDPCPNPLLWEAIQVWSMLSVIQVSLYCAVPTNCFITISENYGSPLANLICKTFTQLSNLWWVSSSISKGFGHAMKTGSSRRFKRYLTTYRWASSQIPFTED